jgi:hypothetical protein
MCHGDPVGADIIDRQLHRERLAGPRIKRTYRANLGDLPDGAYVVIDDRAWLVWGDTLLAWSPHGYGERRARLKNEEVGVLTPRSAVAVLAAGYRAAVHPSAVQ